MLTPQIVLKGIDESKQLEEVIQEKIAKLGQHYGHINSCRVVVEMIQRHKHQGKLYNVHVELTVPPRKQLAVTHQQNEDAYVAVRDAFDAMNRQLEEHAEKRHGQVKTHAESIPGRIVRLYKDEGYGFIEDAEGTEYYFSITNVSYPTFEQLMIGDEVFYTPEALDEGWQAHHVTKGKHRPIDETY